MTWRQKNFPARVLLGWLVACGSGCGREPDVVFVPEQLAETYGVGASVQLGVKATFRAPLSGGVHVSIVDAAGVLMPEVTIKPDPAKEDSYFATFQTKPSLPQGRHQGRLELRLCRDPGCSTQHPGSPWYLPYDFQIIPDTNLTLLTRWTQVPDWEMFQGNAAHTSYVPVTLDASRFSPRWHWTAPENTGGLSSLAVANGLIYLSSPEYSSSNTRPRLFALRESDSGKQWQFDFSAHELNPPAVSGGKVYVATSGHSTTFMWSFDAATGAQLSKAAFYSQWQRYKAPTIEGGVVYTNGGSYGGMYAFSFADGVQRWFQQLPQYDEWTPAVDAKYAYAYTGGLFSALDKSTGEVAFTINDPVEQLMRITGTPVIGSNGSVLVVNDGMNVVSFNPVSRAKNWSLAGRYGSLASANGVLYVTNTSPYGLEARSEATGELLWSWAPVLPEGFLYSGGEVLVTDNLVFVSTSRRVYAIDLTTHKPVWSYWEPGRLALSANGVLYVQGKNSLGAVNLK